MDITGIETSLDKAQDAGLHCDTAETAFLPFLCFNTREEYLAWRAAWRARINLFPVIARQARSLHMQVRDLDKQAEALTDPTSRLAVLDASAAAWNQLRALESRSLRRERATSLLALRAASKREAGRQWAAARLAAAA